MRRRPGIAAEDTLNESLTLQSSRPLGTARHLLRVIWLWLLTYRGTVSVFCLNKACWKPGVQSHPGLCGLFSTLTLLGVCIRGIRQVKASLTHEWNFSVSPQVLGMLWKLQLCVPCLPCPYVWLFLWDKGLSLHDLSGKT